MEPSLSRYFNCNEPQSEASKKFDYVAAVHICIEVQVHSVICLPDVFKVEKKKKKQQILQAVLLHNFLPMSLESHARAPTIHWCLVLQQKRMRSPGSQCHSCVSAEQGPVGALTWTLRPLPAMGCSLA